jgi:hypothetical protein
MSTSSKGHVVCNEGNTGNHTVNAYCDDVLRTSAWGLGIPSQHNSFSTWGGVWWTGIILHEEARPALCNVLLVGRGLSTDVGPVRRAKACSASSSEQTVLRLIVAMDDGRRRQREARQHNNPMKY